MTDAYDFPSELVELRAHLRAEAAWSTPSDVEAADRAYREVQDLAMALHRNEWLREAGGHSVRAVLLKMAKVQLDG